MKVWLEAIVQDCQYTCTCLTKPLEEGAFTIHRNENILWSGTWTDMTIPRAIWENSNWTRQYHTQEARSRQGHNGCSQLIILLASIHGRRGRVVRAVGHFDHV